METYIKALAVFAPMFIGSIVFESVPREWLNLKVTYFTYHSFTIKIELRRNLSVEINSSYRYDGENLSFEDFYVTLEDGTEIFPTTEAIQHLQTKAQEKIFELYFHEIERDYYANLVEDEKEHEW